MQANLDVGGYAWARYGFTTDKHYVQRIIDNCINPETRKAAKEVFDNFYNHNDAKVKFQMRNLTGFEWSKDLLLGSKWDGELLLDDKETMKIFTSYLTH